MPTPFMISIIVLNYNGKKHLESSIPALQKLTYPNHEIIVVDNGSSDSSVEYLNQFSNIRIVKNNKNLGYSKGKNQGVEESKGKYILLMDNDIVINDPSTIEQLLKLSQDKNDNCFISLPCLDSGQEKTVGYGGFGFRYFLSNNKPVSVKALEKCDHYNISGLIGANIFCARNNWSALGGFDTSQPFNIDDCDLGFRAWLLGYSCYLYSKTYTNHIGIATRVDNSQWCWKYKYHFSGIMRVIAKNLLWYNAWLFGLAFFILEIIKTLKQSITRKSLCPVGSFFWSIGLFLIKLPETLKLRKEIQSKRVINKDTFLFIKKPKF
ncbi:glycosyltransferase family 2 protein [Patescibacteria group bacterium]|nr:glycosyltransferase family 2 protein [Patescibacteria group bacterium]MBU1889966.1 glycosyltransferase family 2 protein [Patescibacteria group bacterium]